MLCKSDNLQHHMEINAVKYLEDCSTKKIIRDCVCVHADSKQKAHVSKLKLLPDLVMAENRSQTMGILIWL